MRSFRVANHRSIRDEQELVLLPAYDKGKPVVPVAAVFGANASGKSNLLDALRWMSLAVLNSYTAWEADAGVPRSPFRLDVRSPLGPSLFVVDIVTEGVQYVYGFSADNEKIQEEWLYSYPHKHKRVIFERTGPSIEFGSTIPERRARADLLASFTRDNSLLLGAAMQAKQEEVAPVYRWFREGIRILGGFGAGSRLVRPTQLASAVERFPAFVDLLRVADLGISGIRVVEAVDELPAVDKERIALMESALPRLGDRRDDAGELLLLGLLKELTAMRAPQRRREVLFLHGEESVALSPEDQSDGTLAWINLLVPALEALASGATLVTDEIDSSLHPRLTARLIELFRSDESNPLGAQLIFTTHDATLLGTSFGRDILDRDEVWFVEKDQSGATALFPLSDFHPRKGENTERRYLGGSYGAVPAVYSDTFVELVAARRETDSAAS